VNRQGTADTVDFKFGLSESGDTLEKQMERQRRVPRGFSSGDTPYFEYRQLVGPAFCGPDVPVLVFTRGPCRNNARWHASLFHGQYNPELD